MFGKNMSEVVYLEGQILSGYKTQCKYKPNINLELFVLDILCSVNVHCKKKKKKRCYTNKIKSTEKYLINLFLVLLHSFIHSFNKSK